MIYFQLLSETVEPFYEKHGCLKLVLNEYRRYRMQSYDARAISLYRLSPRMSKMCCAVWKDDAKEIEIHEFDENVELWAKLETVSFEIGSIFDCVHAIGKLFVFGEMLDDVNRMKIKVQNIPKIST